MAKKHKKSPGYLLIPAGALIGLGFGMLYNQIAVGVLIGVGAGFLGAFLYETRKRKK